MVAETARQFEALEAQAQRLMTLFIKAGHEAVAPAQIQPANIYLDVIGEALRARSYVFSDPDGEELCLRPDLTVPTCRLHIERHGSDNGGHKAKYCYNGTCFRFQPSDATAAHPREFRQAGIETFGSSDKEKDEAQTVALIVDGLKAAGLTEWELRIGDLGIFRALLESANMPERWRQRLRHQFWRPEAFRGELERLSRSPDLAASRIPQALRAAIDPAQPKAAAKTLVQYFEDEGVELVGVRSAEEIAENLVHMVADAQADPLSPETAALISSYICVRAPAKAAGARLKDLVRDQNIDISKSLESYHRRLQLLADEGVDVVHAGFSAEFGRTLEYYTGFVFEIVVPALGEASPVAGGGRYDGLIRACGSDEDVPAVGAAIHTERLLSAVGLQTSGEE